MKFKNPKILSTLVCLSALAAGCSDKVVDSDGVGGQGGDAAAEIDATVMAQVSANYATIVHATYVDSLTTAQALDEAIAELVATPNDDTLAAAREAWLAAREPYLQSEAFRFYDGPIDNPTDGPEGLLNAWPLDEAYIDYVEGDAAGEPSGIINDVDVEISAEALSALNEQGGEKNIATGYHAIEFLLWGQDLSSDGPGDRPASDYDTAENAERRAEYLTAVSELLVDNLGDLVDAWAPDEDNYRKEFEAAAPDEQLRRILTGLITLSGFETGGERLQTALDTHSQEDEHSCFSDNTHRDMIQDIAGVQNVYLGTYTNVDGDEIGDGSGIFDIVKSADSKLADDLEARIAISLELANDLEVPFDQGIREGNEAGNDKVAALIDSLRYKQAVLLEEVFTDFGLSIPDVE